jgi:hypothetical protein
VCVLFVYLIYSDAGEGQLRKRGERGEERRRNNLILEDFF